MDQLDDYKKVKQLADLFRALDYYSQRYEDVSAEIKALAANMTAKDIKYAIKESEN